MRLRQSALAEEAGHPREGRALSCGGPARAGRGFSLAELLVVLAILGLMAMMGMSGWVEQRRRADVLSAARVVENQTKQARMMAVYQGVTHFVVLDADRRVVSIHADTNRSGQFDGPATDARVASTNWPSSVDLSLPSGVSTLPDPQSSTAPQITSPWSLPDPDSGAGWGSSLKGFAASSTGILRGAGAVPEVIDLGTMVFSDASGEVSAVGLRGREGRAGTFYQVGVGWRSP